MIERTTEMREGSTAKIQDKLIHCNRDLPLISIFHPKKIKGFLTLIKKSTIAEKKLRVSP